MRLQLHRDPFYLQSLLPSFSSPFEQYLQQQQREALLQQFKLMQQLEVARQLLQRQGVDLNQLLQTINLQQNPQLFNPQQNTQRFNPQQNPQLFNSQPNPQLFNSQPNLRTINSLNPQLFNSQPNPRTINSLNPQLFNSQPNPRPINSQNPQLFNSQGIPQQLPQSFNSLSGRTDLSNRVPPEVDISSDSLLGRSSFGSPRQLSQRNTKDDERQFTLFELIARHNEEDNSIPSEEEDDPFQSFGRQVDNKRPIFSEKVVQSHAIRIPSRRGSSRTAFKR